MASYTNYLHALYMTCIDSIVLPAMKAKHLGILKGIWMFPIAMMLYSLQPLIFYGALSVENMGVMNILWNVTSNVVINLIGFFLFGETLTKIQCLGLLLCLVGVTLVGMP
jgi:multidrug transporter EmrE-like cation transporter